MGHEVTRATFLASVLVGAGTATAAESTGPTAAADDTSVQLTEIVVTAARRASNLEDTALAVTALSPDRLEASGITDTGSLLTAIPSLQFESSVGSSFIYLRGIGSGVYGTFSDNSVATYVDGIYIPRQTAAIQELFDISEVEVLRGPQATLYGRNATGGAILITTARPTDEFTGSGLVQGGSYDTQRARLVLSGPLDDWIDGRVSVVRSSHEGYATDLTNNSQLDMDRFWGVRASIEAHPTATLDLLLSSDFSQDNGNMGTGKSINPNSLPFAPPPFGAGTPFSSDPRASYHDIEDSNPQETYGVHLRVSWDAKFASVISTTGYDRYLIGPTYFDIDDSIAPLLEYRGETEHTSFFYQDLLLTYSSSGNPVEWMLGGMAIHQDTGSYLPTLTPGGLDAADAQTRVTGYAGYAQLGYSILPQVKLVGGVRYSVEDRSGSLIVAPPFGSGAPETNSRTWNDTSPKASIEFRPVQGTLVYVSATKGFKSGAFDPVNVKNVASPETIWSYELGLRTELLDDRLALNVTAFHYNYRNLQVFSGVVSRGFIDTYLQNAGHARIDGLEIEPAFSVTRDLRLGANVSLLDARYANGTVLANLSNSVPAPPGGTPTVNSYDVGGNQMIQAPRVSVSVFADLTVPLGERGALDFHADDFYQSSRYFTAFEDPTLEAKAYDVVNLRAQWRMPGDHWVIGAFVRNAGNTLIRGNEDRTPPFGTLVNYGPPRVYGADVGFKF